MDVDTTPQVSIKHGLPEIEIYCYMVVLIFLIDNKKYDEACIGFSSFDIHRGTC
jgi:26S proteasome regulatory subunit N3